VSDTTGIGGPRYPRIDLYRRVLDVVVSTLLILVTLPVVIIAAVGSAASLRAWPFFTQHRVGRHGRLFRFVKIRTLPVDMPDYVDKHQLDMSRIPTFCRLLRRLHLDELPQLFLVLRGRMGLVGPRPEMAYLHDRMPADFAALRTSVRPGCTGLWQVSAACTGLIGEAPEYDRFYLARRALRLDLWVLAQTVRKMIGLGRTLTLDEIPAWAGRPGTEADAAQVAEARSEQVSLPLTASR
jgi:lipopolysaccharide/colanic/teichoic acid biosynthesis glycosyltransferase